MKSKPGLRPMFSLAVVAFIGLTCGLQRAQAETISALTGEFPVSSGSGPVNDNQDFDASVQFDSVSQTLMVRPSIGSYVDNITCGGAPVSSYDECDTGGTESGRVPLVDTWSGTFSGGSVSMTGPLGSFTGTITQGSFSGSYFNDSHESSETNSEDFSFTGTWANGWRSEGTFSGASGSNFGGVSGDLILTTSTTPEPGSVTLLASGMAVFAVLLHRKRQVR
jgi:hypothetical protein